jgi:hypothetical protein
VSVKRNTHGGNLDVSFEDEDEAQSSQKQSDAFNCKTLQFLAKTLQWVGGSRDVVSRVAQSYPPLYLLHRVIRKVYRSG